MQAAQGLAVAATALLLLGAQEKGEPGEDDERCVVYIRELDQQDEASSQLLEKIEKEIKNKKKWFRLTDDEPGADISLELMQFGDVEDVRAHTQRAEGTTGGQSDALERPALLELERGYFIEFQLTVPDQFRTAMTATGRGPGSAAQSLAKHLHTICDGYRE